MYILCNASRHGRFMWNIINFSLSSSAASKTAVTLDQAVKIFNSRLPKILAAADTDMDVAKKTLPKKEFEKIKQLRDLKLVYDKQFTLKDMWLTKLGKMEEMMSMHINEYRIRLGDQFPLYHDGLLACLENNHKIGWFGENDARYENFKNKVVQEFASEKPIQTILDPVDIENRKQVTNLFEKSEMRDKKKEKALKLKSTDNTAGKMQPLIVNIPLDN